MPRPIYIMTNTEIRKANIKILQIYAKELGINYKGLTRAKLVEALLDHKEKPVNGLILMVREDGKTADVHPGMVEEYRINGGYVEVE